MPKFQIEKNAMSVPEFTEIGMYPVYYITSDNGLLCPDCVNSNLDLCRDKTNDQWFVVAQEVNWESCLYCDACSKSILSAYDVVDGDEDSEPCTPNDLSDDAEALASAGFGTDEDYGCWDGTGEEW
jgi:hypothetical protein